MQGLTMHSWKVSFLLGIISIASTSSLNTRQSESCNPANMIDDQRVWTCPHKHPIDQKTGHCFSGLSRSLDSICTAYCEMSLSRGYGREVPVAKGYCGEESTCTYQSSESLTTTQTWTVSAGVTGASGNDISKALTGTFNAGASYAWSKALTYTTGAGDGKTLGANQCGYWTFIPFALTSCGTLTSTGTSLQFQIFTTGATKECDPSKDVKATANWCNTALYTDENGHAGGEVVFVYLDCEHGGLLQNADIPQNPPAKQPAAIFYPGVFSGSINKPSR